jgi:uncharacterized protein Smg (DUF494 family)
MIESVINILDDMLQETMSKLKSYSDQESHGLYDSCLLPYGGYRVLSNDETARLSKASHQFISRLQVSNVIPNYIYEIFMHELLMSPSEFILLEEVKFVLFMVLEEHYSSNEIKFIKFAISKKQQECSIVH